MRYTVTFVELHNPLFMQGTNLGTKINGPQRGAAMFFDSDKKLLAVSFKGRVAIIPDSNICSMDVLELAGFDFPTDKTEEPKRRGRPPAQELTKTAEQATAYPTAVQVATDPLIAQSRAIAAGAKTAQVSNPTKPTIGATGLEGAPKYMSHAQLAAKVAAEKK